MCTKTGVVDIEKGINELGNGDLICIASRPNVDKFTFAYNLAINNANNKFSILIFSLDNSKNTIQKRINKTISKEKHTYILDNILSIAGIEQNAKLIKLEKDVGIIIIDYLQLIKSDGTTEEIIKRLKSLAKELNVAIIILSQLSLKIELREDKRPVLSDFKKSSAIIDYADIIMFLYNNKKQNTIENITPKNK